MSSTSSERPGVIRADRLNRRQQSVIVDSQAAQDGSNTGAIAVIPVVDGEQVAGLEVRCNCGARVIVECVYEGEE